MTRDWMDTYNKMGALWIHDGNPRRPHALLASGNHSGGFFNSRLVIADEPLLRAAATELVTRFVAAGGNIDGVTRIVGSQTGATKLAQYISEEFSKRRKRECFWASPAKYGEGEDKRMVFDDPTRKVLPLELVLLCEDVGTTFRSVQQTIECVQRARGLIHTTVLVLVNRSGKTVARGRKIVALIERDLPIWTPDECPLCKQGSVALRPKDNWAELNGTY